MKELKERCEKQAMLLISRTLLNKDDFKPSSIIDFNFGPLIFLGGEDRGLTTPNTFIRTDLIDDDQQYLESEEIQNTMRDKLTYNDKGKMTFF